MDSGHNRKRRIMASLLLAAGLLFPTMGLECDQEAKAAFRDAATGTIGEGVKTIFNGILDGIIASIEDAGDGGATSTQ